VTAGAMFSRSLGQVIGLTIFGALFAAVMAASLRPRVEDVLASVPDDVRAAVVTSTPELSGSSEGIDVAFDRAAAQGRIAEVFAEQAPETLNGGPQAVETARAATIGAIDQLQPAFTTSLTRAVRTLYWIG